MYPSLGRGRGHGADHDWTAPTPVSLRREEAQRRGGDQAAPRPALARPAQGPRDLTPDELAMIQNRARAGVTREPAAQFEIRDRAARPALGHVMAADRRGLPCACGPDHDPRPCLAHAATVGHRRHIRPD
jgi:hypothetical protein